MYPAEGTRAPMQNLTNINTANFTVFSPIAEQKCPLN